MPRVRMGMVGGGPGAFMGTVHRAAAALDGRIELVCGAFSRDADRSREAGAALGLPPDRVYDDYRAMIEAEAALPEAERMQFVSIVTPNDSHFAVAECALRSGFHVFLEKPATTTLAEARKLHDAVAESGCRLALAHAYIGYPMVQEARERVARGELGEITRVQAEYTQGWLSRIAIGDDDSAVWRLDPQRAGISCTMADIGVHAFNIAEFVCGRRIERLLADVGSAVPDRELDDDGAALVRFDNGARGVLVASQTCTGDKNDLRLRVYGTLGGLEWHQETPDRLTLRFAQRPDVVVYRGDPYVGRAAKAFTRVPAGHPEGYTEAFGNLYRSFTAAIGPAAERPEWLDHVRVPGIEEGVRGMAFIEAVMASGTEPSGWRAVDAGAD